MMKDIKERTIDRAQWLAALHVKGAADAMLTVQMEKAEQLLTGAAAPKTVYRILERSELTIRGFSIEKHLEGCHRVVIIGATLGIAVDNLIRKTQVTDMALAVILDAGASLMIEQVCDDLQEEIREKLSANACSAAGRNGSVIDGSDLHFTSRFSPGYGDYPLAEQSRIHRYLDASRKIGLTLTADHLMIPRKSITALMGIADHPVAGRLATCGECVLREKCTLRKEGKYCGNQL